MCGLESPWTDPPNPAYSIHFTRRRSVQTMIRDGLLHWRPSSADFPAGFSSDTMIRTNPVKRRNRPGNAELPDTRSWRGFPHPKRRSRGPLQVEFLVQAGTALLSATVTAR
jgi:hypothetical protein